MRRSQSKILQLVLGAASFGLAMLVASCSNGHTFGYAYVLSSPGAGTASIWAYNVNSSTGQFSPTNDAQTPTQAPGAISVVATPDGANLYVLFGATTIPQTGLPADNGQHSIVHYGIRPVDGDITPLDTTETGGTEPVALALDPSGNYLYAVDTYQPGFSNGSPGPGDVTIFQLVNGVPSLPATCAPPAGTGTVTAQGNGCYYSAGFGPRGVTQTAISSGATYVYVANSGNTATPLSGTCYGTVSGFSLGADGGLTPLNFNVPAGSCANGGNPFPTNALPLGTSPWAITTATFAGNANPYLYVTDYGAGGVYELATNSGIAAQSKGPYGVFSITGGQPESVIAQIPAVTAGAAPQPGALFVSNFQQNTVSSFTVSTAGQLTPFTNYVVGTGPTCVTIDPSGMYFYVTNYLNGNVSGFSLVNPTGQLAALDDQPYIIGTSTALGTSNPTCLALAPKTDQ
jgi:6-phosphogluconolactonase